MLAGALNEESMRINQDRHKVLSYQMIKQLEKEFGSSFYLFDLQQLRENYHKIAAAFRSRYDNFIIGYSYKTNYLPYLCKELAGLGAYAEVVSRLEYDLAIKIGQDPKKIIFNGPLKTKEDIEYALTNESMINLDSLYEIDFVKEYCLKNSEKHVKVGLRVNYDISTDGISPLVEGYEISRFGLCLDNGSFGQAVRSLSALKNVTISGLHGHFSTSGRTVGTFQKITQGLCDIAKEYKLFSLEYIDVGGGIFGEVPKSIMKNTPSFADYAEAICQIMNKEFRQHKNKPALVLEPGISMVANTFRFAAKVVETKKIRKEQFVLAAGSAHNIKPTFHKKNLPMTILRKSKAELLRHRRESFHIVGYTCLEKDYLANSVEDIVPEREDYLVFENVGAYTIVFNPPFIKERPGIVALDGNEWFPVRKRETISEFFHDDLYCF
ncbi:diaminopimelate decarboxylase [Evansella caseinilytica]|uniref:Diaminopimelate decarboxylase n=1 Tax=Evansella caseinilytica TaxID=1503961 RepID=A0A1H3UNC4_9BACI|nr:diaminopimelate decarboxylase [Evansella caseinilytica]SDZ63335.1 diaminopimelate decarboxylase [Evansella caseinilytica]